QRIFVAAISLMSRNR
ncbi:hypothetical protein D039_0280B, partial [Vibrio parahaemolyticus EKP-028]